MIQTIVNFTKEYQGLGRVTGLVLFGGMILRQFYYHPFRDNLDSIQIIRWLLVTILFILFFSAYIKRSQAKETASNLYEIFLPFICAALPFAILLGPSLIYTYRHSISQYPLITPIFELIKFVFYKDLWPGGLIIMAIGEIITVWGMFFLKSSFSIMTEARALVTKGIYKYVRHPLYIGEILSVIGYALFYPCWWTIIGCLIFTTLQLTRAKIEENKLIVNFPFYKSYKKETGFIFPKMKVFFRK